MYIMYDQTKNDYLRINNNMIGGADVIACIPGPNDRIYFGDGGSSALIVITDDKRVYKVFTQYLHMQIKNIKTLKHEMNENEINEINIYKQLTKHIINKNISDHYVKYLGDRICKNAKKIFDHCPKTYTEYLNTTKNDEHDGKQKMCEKKFKGHPVVKLQNNYKIIETEFCDFSCKEFIQTISRESITMMEKFLDIFLFQIIYTLVTTKKIFPYFSHNDLFMRNILGIKESDNGNYYTYNLNKKNYYVPQKLFFPKINDFGLTNLNEKYRDTELYDDIYRDIWNLLFDIYDGGNIGSNSLSILCETDPIKMSFLKKYFGNFFNVMEVDEYVIKSQKNMNWDWNNALDKDFRKSIGLQDPDELLDNYFIKKFGSMNNCIKNYSDK